MCWQLNDWQLGSLCQTYPLFIINFKELLCGHNEAEGAPDLGQMALGFVPCTRAPAPSVGPVCQGPRQRGQGWNWSLSRLWSLICKEGGFEEIILKVPLSSFLMCL